MAPKVRITTVVAAVAAAAMLSWAPALLAAAAVSESTPVEVPGPKAPSATAAAAAAPDTALAAPAPAAGTSWVDNMNLWINQTKTPVPWMKWGADLRVRDEYLSAAGLDAESPATGAHADHTNWLRIRGRWWTTVTPVKDLDFNFRVEWEGREWTNPNDVNPMWAQEQVTIDSANIKASNVLGAPLTLILGRQDIILGDGWLVLDGTPYDGSRTIFFDAVRGIYEAKEINTSFDFIFIDQTAKGDALVEPMLTYGQNVIEQDETGFILWVTNRSLKNTEINGYYMYKDMTPVASNGDNGHIHTFGARIAGDIDENWKYRAEGATQFGDRNGQELRAFGFNSRLTYQFKDAMSNQLRLSYEYLSGDDPSTKGTNEAWVPLWGRWPQWSELYVYTVAFTGEQRIAEITDLYRLAFGWSIKPLPKLEFAADYHLLFAPENTKAGTPGFSDSGSFRGQLLTLLTTYEFTEHIRGHLLAEFFFPGNFYVNPRDDIATMLRAELYFTW